MTLYAAASAVQEWPAWTQAGIVSAVVAGVIALVGQFVSTRNNRKAIEAADKRNHAAIEAGVRNVELTNQAAVEREREKWRREALVEFSASVLEKSKTAVETARAQMDDSTADQATTGGIAFPDVYTRALDELSHEIMRLRLIGTDEVCSAGQQLLSEHYRGRGAYARWLDHLNKEPRTDDDPHSSWAQEHKNVFLTMWKIWDGIQKWERDFLDATRASLGVPPVNLIQPTSDQTAELHSTEPSPESPAAEV